MSRAPTSFHLPAAARVLVICHKQLGDMTLLEPTLAKLVSLPDRDLAGCRGFVVDLAGATAAEDWDGVLTGAGGPITVLPDTVGILRERVPEHPELTAGRRTPHGPLDVFHRP